MTINTKYKYPRTVHLPWSPGKTSDDKTLTNVDHFVGKEIVVTEKRDGENTTLYRDGYHARSVDSRFHPSRSFVAQLQGEIGYLLGPSVRVCGENLYAQHSIEYTHLRSYFEVFSVWVGNSTLNWDDTVATAERLGLVMVPILYRGMWSGEEHLSAVLDNHASEDEVEGYVVRLARVFNLAEFSTSVAKYVRENHVETDEHWTRRWSPNKLADSSMISTGLRTASR